MGDHPLLEKDLGRHNSLSAGILNLMGEKGKSNIQPPLEIARVTLRDTSSQQHREILRTSDFIRYFFRNYIVAQSLSCFWVRI